MTASTPGEAFETAEAHPDRIDLMLTDLIMPEMNGWELAKALMSRYPKTACLYMSGYTENAVAHHGVFDEGINYIQKPFSKHSLATKVRDVLDSRSMRRK